MGHGPYFNGVFLFFHAFHSIGSDTSFDLTGSLDIFLDLSPSKFLKSWKLHALCACFVCMRYMHAYVHALCPCFMCMLTCARFLCMLYVDDLCTCFVCMLYLHDYVHAYMHALCTCFYACLNMHALCTCFMCMLCVYLCMLYTVHTRFVNICVNGLLI